MGTPREDAFDKRVTPAADRINGTIPDRRNAAGKAVPVAMEDTTYSKRDGAYTNGILQDIAALIHRGHAAQGLVLEEVKKLDSELLALRGVIEAKEAGTVDADAVAAQIVELLGDDIGDEVIEAIVRRLKPEGA
jgi:hypothetical protein